MQTIDAPETKFVNPTALGMRNREIINGISPMNTCGLSDTVSIAKTLDVKKGTFDSNSFSAERTLISTSILPN